MEPAPSVKRITRKAALALPGLQTKEVRRPLCYTRAGMQRKRQYARTLKPSKGVSKCGGFDAYAYNKDDVRFTFKDGTEINA